MKIRLFAGLLWMSYFMSSHAAIPSIDGKGSALFFPYYTVNGGHDTLLTLANSTTQVKALKLRFFDGKFGKEVLDFNLFLSPYDVWTAAISKNSAGGATLRAVDRSCTYPPIGDSGVLMSTVNFTEVYQGKVVDNQPQRTSEGHLEVYEMGNVVQADLKAALLHSSKNGLRLPSNCDLLNQVYDLTDKTVMPPFQGAVTAATGGVWGSATIVNVGAGISYSYDAEALHQVHRGPQHTGPGAQFPSMENAEPETTFVDDKGVYSAKFSGPLGGVNALSALWMRAAVFSEWITDAAIKAGTELIFVMPSKKHTTPACGAVAAAPFTYVLNCQSYRSLPEEIEIMIYDLESRTNYEPLDFTSGSHVMSKVLPASGYSALVWGVNVVTVNNSNVVGSELSLNLNSPSGISAAGWLGLRLAGTYNEQERALVSEPNATLDGVECGRVKMLGLPVLGFSINKFMNGAVGTPPVLSNYGNSYQLKYKRRVTCQ